MNLNILFYYNNKGIINIIIVVDWWLNALSLDK